MFKSRRKSFVEPFCFIIKHKAINQLNDQLMEKPTLELEMIKLAEFQEKKSFWDIILMKNEAGRNEKK